jgi:hypothetical protein
MSSITTAVYRSFDGYTFPRNGKTSDSELRRVSVNRLISVSLEHGAYQCGGCIFSTNNRREYLTHHKQWHEKPFRFMLETIETDRSTNEAIDELMHGLMNDVTGEAMHVLVKDVE